MPRARAHRLDGDDIVADGESFTVRATLQAAE